MKEKCKSGGSRSRAERYREPLPFISFEISYEYLDSNYWRVTRPPALATGRDQTSLPASEPRPRSPGFRNPSRAIAIVWITAGRSSNAMHSTTAPPPHPTRSSLLSLHIHELTVNLFRNAIQHPGHIRVPQRAVFHRFQQSIYLFLDRCVPDTSRGASHPGERVIPRISKLITSEIGITIAAFGGLLAAILPLILTLPFPPSFRSRRLLLLTPTRASSRGQHPSR